MPDLPLTPSTSGMIFLNRGDQVIFSSYLPQGMIYSAFSRVRRTLFVPVIAPRTAFPARLIRFRWMVAMFITVFIGVVYPKQGSCKGCNFTKPNQQTLMDLALWRYEDPAEQQHQPTYRKHRRCKQLYVRFHFLFNLKG